MKRRAASRLAWGLAALAFVLGTGTLVLMGLRDVTSARLFDGIAFTLAFMIMALVGAFIASRPGEGKTIEGRVPVRSSG